MKKAKNTRTKNGAKAVSFLELGRQVSQDAAWLVFACEDKDTPPWARHLIKAALDYIKHASRRMKEGFAEDFVGRVAIIQAVAAAVKTHCKTTHTKKALHLPSKVGGQTRRHQA